MFDLSAYLSRIDYSGPVDRSIETLRALHRSHILNVPFENLDISLGRKIVLDKSAILHKVINCRRGGFCYELNCAFAALLRVLGFNVTMLSARVARANGGEGPEFDHLTLRVDLNEPWLADVGFGDSFLEPLRLEPAIDQIDPAGMFRLVQDGERFRMEKAASDRNWEPQYSFNLQTRHLHEFAAMCRHHQTSPDSSFTHKRICSRATLDGRITLSGLQLIVTRNGVRKEKELASEEEWRTTLDEEFRIRL